MRRWTSAAVAACAAAVCAGGSAGAPAGGVLRAETPAISGGGQVDIEREQHPERFVVPEGVRGGAVEPQAPPLLSSFDAFAFDDNAPLHGGGFFIPPDPDGAVGPNHVVNVVNTSIEWWTKTGTLKGRQALDTFFSTLSPLTDTFDPKVVYDQFAARFVVATMERTTSPSQTSRVFFAVSDDSNPNGTWYFHAQNTKLTIGGQAGWADFPGLAVDEEALYFTANMFDFPGNAFLGSRLWILNKTPFYAGGAAAVTVHDPQGASGGVETTMQPTQIYGTAPAGVGTWLVTYSGLNDGTNVYLQLVRVDNPLATPSFTLHQFTWGTRAADDDVSLQLQDAPQSGTSTRVETNDRRVSHTPVWRGNNLYFAAPTRVPSGGEAGQTKAHWWRIGTTMLASPTVADQGNVDDEAIAAGAYSFFPAVTVDAAGRMAVGFAASAPTIFPGAYYSGRLAGDTTGTTQPPSPLAAGTDFYVRRAGGTSNRWGDYSSIDLDPSDGTSFWVYNQYAMTRGTVINGEDGRWATRWGTFQLAPPPVCSRSGDVLTVNVTSAVGIGRSGDSFAVTGDGNPDPTCGGATVNNVNTVNVTGTNAGQTLVLSLANGPFAPGATLEGSGTSEIELAIDLGAGNDTLIISGSATADKFRFGTLGANLNADDDGDDLTLGGIESLIVSAGTGNDVLSLEGGQATGSPLSIPATLNGQANNDKLTGGSSGDVLDGGDGKDTCNALRTGDGPDVCNGGPGVDTASYAKRAGAVTLTNDGGANDGAAFELDRIGADVENLTGGKGGDSLSAFTPGANVAKGGAGNDTIDVRDGVATNKDQADGGADTDTCHTDAGDTELNCEA